MTTLGKILAIVCTFLSVAFLGFAFAARIAGPNWEGEAAALENYTVETIRGDKGEISYTVKSKLTQEAVKANSKVLPDVIVAAYNHEVTELGNKIAALEQQPEPLKRRNEELDAHQQADRKAMVQREAELAAEFEKVVKQIQDLSVEGDKVAQEALTIWREEELRREDVYRLRNHLEELDIDLFQQREQKKRLQDELSRLRGVLARLQRRNTQLQTASTSE